MGVWKSRVVPIGPVMIGGKSPIQVQSMTTTATANVGATVEQIMRIADEGCAIVRVAVQGNKEAYCCEQIKDRLLKNGYDVALVADVHFYPLAAMVAAEFADKVRINPGNFAAKKFKQWTDEAIREELLEIEERFCPLVEKCKKLKKTLRIGANQGSLSSRVLHAFGDTPEGMVASVLEYAHLCRSLDFHHFVFSLKASNPQIMVRAYRLLVAKMCELGWDYPLHLGVTESGFGDEGRIRSAIGIGSLLLEGIGDTLRISLTEDPWKEIAPAQWMVQQYGKREGSLLSGGSMSSETGGFSWPLHKEGSVFLRLSCEDLLCSEFFSQIGFQREGDRWAPSLAAVDGILLEGEPKDSLCTMRLHELKEVGIGIFGKPEQKEILPFFDLDEITDSWSLKKGSSFALRVTTHNPLSWEKIPSLCPTVLFLSLQPFSLDKLLLFFSWRNKNAPSLPVVLHWKEEQVFSWEALLLSLATETGFFLSNGMGEGLMVEGSGDILKKRNLAFALLQGCGKRRTTAEFISCPGCGRTQYPLQKVAEEVKKKTFHLAGLKIAVMGCIVNGPGEMADADFGCIGSLPDQVDLYVKKDCVKKHIAVENAAEELIEQIRLSGKWCDPPQ